MCRVPSTMPELVLNKFSYYFINVPISDPRPPPLYNGADICTLQSL